MKYMTPKFLPKFFRKLAIILEMIKIEHTVFALPFAFMGALLGVGGLPSGRQAFFILAAMVGARSAAMAFNRLVDAEVDGLNPRTQNRAIPRGLISRGATLAFIAASTLIFVWAAANLNRLCLYLSPVALGVVLFYSFTKRFTWASHFFLGAALGLAPVAGWLAVTGTLALTPLILGLAVVMWVSGFDILYALQDEEFDRQIGLKSIPCRWGRVKALGVAKLLHLGAALGFVMTGFLAQLGGLYYSACLAAGVILWGEHRLLSPHDLSRLNQAFFTFNGAIGLLLGAATLFSVWPS